MSFRITQKQHALQRAAVLEDLRIRTEQNQIVTGKERIGTRKQLHEGYTALSEYWTDIDDEKARGFKVKAELYAAQRIEDHHYTMFKEAPKQQTFQTNEHFLKKNVLEKNESKLNGQTSVDQKNESDYCCCVIL